MNTALRNYDLLGPDGEQAVERGLASAQWYHSNISREQIKELMSRSDQPAIRDTAIWLGLLLGCAAVAIALWPSAWAWPFLLIYGVLYGSSGDSRWHECVHRTAFKTPWMNDTVYHIASFMMIRNPVVWMWSHSRHHSDTIIVGRDPEISQMRPPKLWRLLMNLFGLRDGVLSLWRMLRHATGRLDPQETAYVPERERPRAYRVARIWCVIYASTIITAIAMASWLPLLLIGLPRFYGAWHQVMTGVLQHAGLADNVLDHRLNSRTVYMNPISRFVYWNMNYHVEHHMFPTVPFHALPRLHALIKDDLPPANSGILDAWKEVLGALWRQRTDPDYYLRKTLPPSAQPYRAEFHAIE